MNQNRMMYGFIDEMEKTAFLPAAGVIAGLPTKAPAFVRLGSGALNLGSKVAPWLLRAGKSAVSAIKPLATKALSFAKSNPFLASSMMSSGASLAQTGGQMVRPPKIQQPMTQVRGIKPAPTDSSAMRTNFS